MIEVMLDGSTDSFVFRSHSWNNFVQRLPDGTDRLPDRQVYLSERRKQLIRDLDRVLEEQRFDIEKYQNLREQISGYFHEWQRIMDTAKQEGRKTSYEEEIQIEVASFLQKQVKEELYFLLMPVGKRMMELGYSEAELIV